MALEYLLMGAQAAGLVTDMWSQSMAFGITKRGAALDAAQLDLRMKQERIASMEQSIANLDTLAEVLATQRAMAAARGSNPGAGSNLALAQKSVTAFNKDEQARALNLEFLGQQRDAQAGAARIALYGEKAKMGANLFNKSFGMIPFSQLGQKVSPSKKPAGLGAFKGGFQPMKRINFNDSGFLNRRGR